MKYLVLNFENAGFFRNHRGTRDKIYDIDGSRPRKVEENFQEPITIHQISNVLHVLFGERPVPINRYTFYDKVPYLFEKSKDCLLRIDNFVNDKGFYQREFIQLKKADWNSWKQEVFMNWNVVRKLLEQEYFEMLTSTLKSVFGPDIMNYTFNEVKQMIKSSADERLGDMFKVLNENGKSPLYHNVYSDDSRINMNHRTYQTNLHGIDYIVRLHGKILVPVSDDDIKVINANKGFATLLDGGLVTIENLLDSNFINTSGFIKVSDISTKKIEL